MDELQSIKDAIMSLKKTLTFLLEQEKLRKGEVDALNDKIDALNSYVVNDIVEPTNKMFKEARFDEFNSKYGERLGKFDEMMRKTSGNPEYSTVREAFNQMDEVPSENFDEEGYIAAIEGNYAKFVEELKAELSIPADVPTTVTDDGNGNVKVEADLNKDGTPETVAEDVSTESTEVKEEKVEETPAEEKQPAEETPAEESSTEEDEEDSEKVDPELQKYLDEYLKK